jgi:hypothetical protein
MTVETHLGKGRPMTPARATSGDARPDLWFDEDRAYAVVTSAAATPVESGLSHVGAMRLAERLRSDGSVATVVHVVGGTSYEVDRYPVR